MPIPLRFVRHRVSSRVAAGSVLLLVSILALGAEVVAPKRILILCSFGREFSPFNTVASVLRTELVRDQTQSLAFYEASLDAARPGPPEDDGALVEFLRTRFADRIPGLVVTIGPPAARFALRNHGRLYPAAPLPLSAADERALHGVVLGAKDAAVATRVDLLSLVDSPKTSTRDEDYRRSPRRLAARALLGRRNTTT
jgi:hypothetical protein